MASKIISKLVKPPISLFGVEGKYVNALFSAASKSNKLDAVEGDLKRLSGLYTTDARFREFMINPIISPTQKNHILENELKNKLKLNDLTVNLLSAMSENRRLKHLPMVGHAFDQIMTALRNELHCTVISARPLSEAKRKEVEESLKAFTSKKLLFNHKTDPTIMGGLIVDFNGEHYIDMSVKSKMRLYSENLKQI